MIHEVMVLDHSGPLFGLVLYGAAVKLFLLSALLLHLVLPFTLGVPVLDWLLFVVGIGAIAVGIGVVESIMARLRLRYVPSLLIASASCVSSGSSSRWHERESNAPALVHQSVPGRRPAAEPVHAGDESHPRSDPGGRATGSAHWAYSCS